jgi:hypothetical protein
VATLGKAVLVVEGDWSKLQQETKQQVEGPVAKTFGSGFGKIAAVAGGVFAAGAAVDQLRQAVGAASDLNESINVTGLVFGEAAAGMDAFFASSAENLGMAESAARQAAGNVGSLLGNLGFGAEEASEATQQLLTRAADLGSAFNAEPEEVVTALGAALRGETEPARRFGIMLDKASVQAKAVEMGLADSTKEVDKNAEAQAALALMMEQSNKVAGDFANTADGQANAARIVSAQWEDFQAQLGQALLPAVAAVMSAFKRLLPVLQSFGRWLAANKPVLAAVGIAIMAVLVPAFVAWAASAAAAAAATLLAAAPFIAIGAVIAAVAYVIIRNWDTIKEVTVAVWDAITSAVSAAFDFIKRWAPIVARILIAVWTGGMSELLGLIIRNWDTIVNFIKGIPGRITSALGSLASLLKDQGMKLINGLLSGITSAWESVRSWVAGIGQRVKDGIGDVTRKLYSIGADLIRGFIDGIRSMAGNIIDAITDTITDALPGFVKKALGIGSPSKLFYGFGRDTMLGFALGIERNADLPMNALDAAMGPLDTSGAMGAAGGLSPLQPVDARIVVHGSIIGLEELDRYADQRDRRLAASLGARR